MANQTASGGTGFSILLTVAFIVLKLCKVIDWPWLWVWSPFWIPFAIAIIVILVYWAWLLVRYMVKKR